MTPFDRYATYYDALYRDKDYVSEAAYVDGLLRQHRPGIGSILELGCGTGAHAMALAALGHAVTGVDRSSAMVQQACHRKGTSASVDFSIGDLTTFRAGRTFDAVLSLFHVVSYQVSNADLQAAMQTAAIHLAPGGLFLFDCWYGPAVLTTPPEVRIRRLESNGLRMTRLAEPLHLPDQDRVDVKYEILLESDAGMERVEETHSMRYLFEPEVRLLVEQAGMDLVDARGWLSPEAPTCATWYACFVARRRGSEGRDGP